jgi:hypothetical protein
MDPAGRGFRTAGTLEHAHQKSRSPFWRIPNAVDGNAYPLGEFERLEASHASCLASAGSHCEFSEARPAMQCYELEALEISRLLTQKQLRQVLAFDHSYRQTWPLAVIRKQNGDWRIAGKKCIIDVIKLWLDGYGYGMSLKKLARKLQLVP